MEDFSIIYKGTLTTQDATLFDNQKGCIVKNLMIYNTQAQSVQVNLSFDDVLFIVELQANEFKKIDILPFTQKIVANGDSVNIHISGLVIT